MNIAVTHEAAARLARTIISDIALYNKPKIEEGLKNDSLFDVLEEELAQGEELYIGRVDPEILKTTNYYNKALVDILIKRNGDIESKIW